MSFTYTYWRINVINSTRNVLAIAEIEFFDASSAQIATTAGTASADDVTFGAAANAFDGNAGTFWATSSPATPAAPHWIQYQFPSAVTVGSYSIANRNDANWQNPDSWSLQGSNDGTTWTTIGNYSAAWTSVGQVQTFTVGSYGLGTAYRLLITATQGVAGVVALAEVVLNNGGGTAISLTNGASSASSIFTGENNDGSAAVFDGDASTYWASNAAPSSGSPEWIAFRFVDAETVGSFSITSRLANQDQAPASFSLQSSTDGTTWTTLQSYTSGTWTSGSAQTFSVTVVATAVFRKTRSALGTRVGSRQRTH